MDGLLIVDKPSGPTSHDVVQELRRLTGIRVGHTGTLDPLATGVLLLCLGRATRLARFLSAADKTYEGTIRLGAATDTFDAQGRVTFQAGCGHVTQEQVRREAARLTGPRMQTPPPYSARKVAGRRLHRLARAGTPAAAPPAPVVVRRFEVLEAGDGRIRFEAVVSSGTYVRALADELGRALECGAHLEELRRTRCAGIGIEDALPMETLRRLARDKRLGSVVLPLERMELGMASVVASSAGREAMRHGRPLTARDLEAAGPLADAAPGTRLRVQDSRGALLGIAVVGPDEAGEARLRPDVVLAS
ncbi:MAG TPA: tRNA pseudouridine(55) synthase TruB [Candidatus Polarisedimenticolia bacterium]|nr:tRNA pseudouridine(55) synthase TruB [Candidatus Polarisedimenticolia bacterium]